MQDQRGMQNILFVLAMAFIFTHELDAVRRHEWRIFPLTSKMSDEAGFSVYILAHVPLFALIIWFSFLSSPDTAGYFKTGFSIFCVIHVILHMTYQYHPKNEFNNPMSQTLIWAGGIFGAAYLMTTSFGL
jgi:hypothetical protein